MNTVIFGANGATGRHLVHEALAAGHHVTAAVRRPGEFDVEHPRLTVAKVDVFDESQVDAAMGGADAVLSALGVPFSREAIHVYSRGTANIVASMKRHGVRRLLVTSSSAADPAVRFKNSGGGLMLELLKPLVIFVWGRTTYADMRRMEGDVRVSGLDVTIVRPSGLFDATEKRATTWWRTTTCEGPSPLGSIWRHSWSRRSRTTPGSAAMPPSRHSSARRRSSTSSEARRCRDEVLRIRWEVEVGAFDIPSSQRSETAHPIRS